jgi:hypothetical protein
MIRRNTVSDLPELYHTDETGWLERMAALAAEGDAGAMDLEHLSEYLSDMAGRDKREAVQRLVTLLAHLLKWEHQPERRSRSWELTIREQREELQELLESATLRQHAEQELGKAYAKALRRAAVETDLPDAAFPADCPYTLEQAITG